MTMKMIICPRSQLTIEMLRSNKMEMPIMLQLAILLVTIDKKDSGWIR